MKFSTFILSSILFVQNILAEETSKSECAAFLPTLTVRDLPADITEPIDEQYKDYRQLIKSRSARISGRYFAELPFDHPRRIFREELGFKLELDPLSEGIAFTAPLDWRIVFDSFNRIVNEAIQSGRGDSRYTLRPAIALKNSENKWKFFRPGLDPLPVDALLQGYFVPPHDKGYIPELYWSEAISKGMLPINMGSYFVHELGHLEDIHAHLELLPLIIEFHKKKYNNGAGNSDFSKSYQLDDIKTDTDNKSRLARYFGLSESLSIPDVIDKPFYQEQFPHLFTAKPITLEQLTHQIKHLSHTALKERLRKVKSVTSHLHLIGGGARDGFNKVKFLYFHKDSLIEDPYPYKLIESLVFKDKSLINKEFYFFYEGLDASIDAIDGMTSLYFNQKEFAEWSDKLLRRDKDHYSKLYFTLVDQLARFEFAIYSAFQLQLTARDVFTDILEDSYNPSKKTYKWMKSYLPEDSFMYEYFVRNP